MSSPILASSRPTHLWRSGSSLISSIRTHCQHALIAHLLVPPAAQLKLPWLWLANIPEPPFQFAPSTPSSGQPKYLVRRHDILNASSQPPSAGIYDPSSFKAHPRPDKRTVGQEKGAAMFARCELQYTPPPDGLCGTPTNKPGMPRQWRISKRQRPRPHNPTTRDDEANPLHSDHPSPVPQPVNNNGPRVPTTHGRRRAPTIITTRTNNRQ
ncbi:uncharacterized protein LACBIDRAFT_333294 [Laccaria bicolor S238N-H82]|uniref:Predicted protein n=1 Tax=Laccaria bicolor (strain S238N-H82 / ATCC MYA-4686) TaxID=486041 RepID=B0DVH4_LACBS|nr:uncharacterized protein LACBIDRAFT_333294 [Laccaria bicolor S238N-H82]EDR01386.1 predicted protein [Laccaria bicolor S238N-H82]|eukprot:XP_001887931.1 predicted protein [Laccaria bicolor S238N-H82]